ncbi:MAG: N-acetylmuramoyl-L-alanine amidase [Chthonomonas sp.]|nr:N-acetylmuramoyl-L-alanine amidase [Chthonomonas sp.]
MIAAVLLTAMLPNVEPTIVTREEWGAKIRRPGAQLQRISKITIHHTGVASAPLRSLEDKLRGLQAFSQREDKLADGRTKPAWVDIPYHYYISIDGRVGEGRRWRYTGDTNTEYDPTGHLLIVVEGNFEIEKPTDAELVTLRQMVLWAAKKFHVPVEEIKGHGDYAKTDCPGKALIAELPALRSFVKTHMK